MILRQVFIPNISNLQNLSDGDFWEKRSAAEDGSVSDYPSEWTRQTPASSTSGQGASSVR